jgi:hypothetical protein
MISKGSHRPNLHPLCATRQHCADFNNSWAGPAPPFCLNSRLGPNAENPSLASGKCNLRDKTRARAPRLTGSTRNSTISDLTLNDQDYQDCSSTTGSRTELICAFRPDRLMRRVSLDSKAGRNSKLLRGTSLDQTKRPHRQLRSAGIHVRAY